MEYKPLVSVIMPAFNSQEYISEAIESILKQSLRKFELLIIDDCSKDNTFKIAKRYAEKDKRIRVYRNEKNIKIARTLNKGIKLSKSNFIARMDADDVSNSERLFVQYKTLLKNKRVAVVGSDMQIIDKDGKIISKRNYPSSNRELKKIMFKYSPFAHPVVMYKKDRIMEFGGYDNTKVPCEDIDLWFKLGSKYNFASIGEYLLKYRILPEYSRKYNLRYIEKVGFKIKMDAVKKYGYRPSFIDLLYNLGQFLTMWMPSGIRICLYDFLRSRRVI